MKSPLVIGRTLFFKGLLSAALFLRAALPMPAAVPSEARVDFLSEITGGWEDMAQGFSAARGKSMKEFWTRLPDGHLRVSPSGESQVEFRQCL